MQTNNPLFDDLARLLTGAAGIVQGTAQEIETAVRAQVERMLLDLGLVRREEFDAVKEMAIRTADELDAVKARLAALEASGIPPSS